MARPRSIIKRQWKDHPWESGDDRHGTAMWIWSHRRHYAVTRSPGGAIRVYTSTYFPNKWKFIIFR